MGQGSVEDNGRRARQESRRDYERRRSNSPHSHKRRRTSHSPDRHRRREGGAQRSGGGGDDDGHSSSRRHRRHHHHRSPSHRHERTADPSAAPAAVRLPFSARQLSKADMDAFMPLFGYFLNVQKQMDLDDLDEREVRGRWKSFMGKWNRGELAEGWYDPDMFSQVVERHREEQASGRGRPQAAGNEPPSDEEMSRRDESDGDDYGPTLPRGEQQGRRSGPGIPSLGDLSVRNEMMEEDREESVSALRAERKADRTLQKERLEELVPRADPGSRERKLEKRQMVNDKMREFRDKSPGLEGNENEIMGGGDSLEEYKKAKQTEQKKKSEREIRREEFDRAKREEVEEKRRAYREREEGTMSMLKELARQRFG